MAPEKAPAFQFYPKDFLSDGNQGEMSLQEVGAYARLMCRCWLELTIPDDATRAANLCGATPTQMRKMWPAIRRCFRPATEPGRLLHPRLEAERGKQATYREEQRLKGLLSAAARTLRATGRQPDGNRGSTGPPTGGQPDHQPEGNSPISDLRSPITEPTGDAIAREAPDRPRYQSTPIFGKNPHLDHAECDPTLSRCVPRPVHSKLVNLLAPKHGGDRDQAGTALKVWYSTVWVTLPAEFVMGDAFRFWQPRFDAAFATPVAPMTPKRDHEAEKRREQSAMLEEMRRDDPMFGRREGDRID